EVGRGVLTFDTGGRLVNVNDTSDTIYDGEMDPENWQTSDQSDPNFREFDADGNLYVAADEDNYPIPSDEEKIDADVNVSSMPLAWNNESDAGQTLDFAFGATQYSSESDVISQSQDGFATGTLVSLSIDGDGNILGNYSNGEPRKLAKVALAKFSNPLGLSKVGNNLYQSSDESGTPVIGTVGSGVGKIFTNSLEMSNVDLAQEFTKMITTQRGFQANSKIITTTDELLGELINLKR
ncbi:MAG: flagellar hook-basal body complex protein, partial [Thermodesulfobacteriota bacterium]